MAPLGILYFSDIQNNKHSRPECRMEIYEQPEIKHWGSLAHGVTEEKKKTLVLRKDSTGGMDGAGLGDRALEVVKGWIFQEWVQFASAFKLADNQNVFQPGRLLFM